MSRWRKIDVRLWNDEKVVRLSPVPACGQGLWIFLLTNRFTTGIGLYSAGEAALAEELGWSLQGFRKAFAEVSREGLVQADWKARVVWIPNFLKYEPPANQNVVKGWRTIIDEVPDCDLKSAALEHIGQQLSEGFPLSVAAAFAEVSGRRFQERSTEPYVNPGAGTGAVTGSGSGETPCSPPRGTGIPPVRFARAPRRGESPEKAWARTQAKIVNERIDLVWEWARWMPVPPSLPEVLAECVERFGTLGPPNEHIAAGVVERIGMNNKREATR